MASVGLIVPRPALWAAGQVQPDAPQAVSQPEQISDVVLADGGKLSGQVVDPQGQPQSGVAVKAFYQTKQVASTVTAKDGTFAVEGLRGGNYVVTAGEATGVYRAWKAGTAPPAAKHGILMVNGQRVARAQGGGGGGGTLLMLGALGGIVAAGVAAQENQNGS